jgi:hypothetical protein
LQFVFGYGSLAVLPERSLTRERDPAGFVADLAGFARVWGVAMDNRRDLPGYKYYTRLDGYRPAAYIAFLDVVETATGSERPCNGVCVPVDDRALEALDARERNYRRLDVSDRVPVGGARVWTYVGSAEGRERLAHGRSLATAIVDAGYLRAVEAAFAGLGAGEQAAAAGSLEPADLPVIELIRHELP